MRPIRSPAPTRAPSCGETDDPPRDQARDLHHAIAARRRIDHDAVALIVVARLVEIGAEEKSRMVRDPFHPALDRRAVHMAIEHRHEDGDPLERPHAKAKLGRRRAESGEADDAVRRRDHQVRAHRRHAGGVAEEIDAPQRRDQPEPAERTPYPP